VSKSNRSHLHWAATPFRTESHTSASRGRRIPWPLLVFEALFFCLDCRAVVRQLGAFVSVMVARKSNQAQLISPEDAKQLLRVLLTSREGDLREQSLIRQGKGWFHIAAMGHEGLAALGLDLQADDYLFPYYRDRALVLQRGLTNYDVALSFYAKRDGSSGGRQLPGHFSNRALNIWSHPSPVGAHLLPACGAAWGLQLDGKQNVVLASLGEAATRQGEFYEAVCFAKERKLPVVFLVEDNRIAISTATAKTNPLALGVLSADEWLRVDGTDVAAVIKAGRNAIESVRNGNGPAFIWADVERFSNHSSADDQRMYREEAELAAVRERDPVERYKQWIIKEGWLTAEEIESLAETIRAEVRADYQRAGQSADPRADELAAHLVGPLPAPVVAPVELGERCRMLDAVNKTFHVALESSPDCVFFGEDIEDPKGGVFNLTKGLSTKAPERVVNSPLAEGTIMGVSVGLAAYGKRPVFEIQFVDFIHPGWNQLVTNMATLRWRSFGDWKCPLVIYAPCGGYLPGGALWHSQSGEGGFARIPGLRVVVPGTPEDVAGLFWTAIHGEDPTLILLPKHLMWAPQVVPNPVPAITLGTARRVRAGDELTLIAWGNCLELCEETFEGMASAPSVDFIDLRSIAPWDREMIFTSVRRTGRLLVVQEDNISCSVGQMIVAELMADATILNALRAAPILVSKEDVHVGFNPIYEYAALPDSERVRGAIEQLLSATAASGKLVQVAATASMVNPSSTAQADAFVVSDKAGDALKVIEVPILGEGIRTARIVAIHKQAGDAVKADDALCEVETDKAVFPIEVDEDGWIESWNVGMDSEVAVGQPIAVLRRKDVPVVNPSATNDSGKPIIAETGAKPGLSAEVIRQMQGVVPATIEVIARWETVRDARLLSKKLPGGTVSTTVMVAWAVAEAMRKHERFASLLRGEKLVHEDDFDLGIAVAQPGDVLETAVMSQVRGLDWDAFYDNYQVALKRVRDGEPTSKKRIPLSISSMGPYQVRSAIPILVPPAVATLFVGAPYSVPSPKDSAQLHEVVALVLTFDHRWINGVGAASFLADVRKGIERFDRIAAS
jgi:2-oxoisovalerate dehydrogenase E1 component